MHKNINENDYNFISVFMVLCFATRDLSDDGKLIYAYVTYIGLTLDYTVNNMPTLH